jgi:hypothetical protein
VLLPDVVAGIGVRAVVWAALLLDVVPAVLLPDVVAVVPAVLLPDVVAVVPAVLLRM